jgi:hypothetical protein
VEKPKHQFRLKTLLAFAAVVCVLSAMAKWELDARRDFAATKVIVGEVLDESRGHIEGLLHTASLGRLGDLARDQNLSLSDEELSGSLRASMGNINHSMYSQTITQTDTAGIYWVVWCDVEQVELKVISGDIDIDCHRPCSLFSTKATVSIVDRGGHDIDRSEIEEYEKTKVNEPVVHRDMREDEPVIELLKRKFAQRGIEATVTKAAE